MDLFEDFIHSCLFMHEDYVASDESGFDWDKYGTKPFLLGITNCVVGSLAGYGNRYLDYLDAMDCLPRNLIIANRYNSKKQGLTDIPEADATYEAIKSLVANHQLHLSTYYGKEEYHQFAARLASKDFSPSVFPNAQKFLELNDKISMRRFLEISKIPVPVGTVCGSVEELQYFCNSVKVSFPYILLKKEHWKTRRISSAIDIHKLEPTLSFPLVAEVFYPHILSPISHSIKWGDKSEILFVVSQIIRRFSHWGNELSPMKLKGKNLQMIHEITDNVLAKIDYEGILGIDFIVTKSQDIYVVDVNPRFNSSTYPFYFLSRMNPQKNKRFAKYSFTSASVPDLTTLYCDENFVSFSPESCEGILLFAPAYDSNSNKVRSFSYLCVAERQTSEKELAKLLLSLVNKHSN